MHKHLLILTLLTSISCTTSPPEPLPPTPTPPPNETEPTTNSFLLFMDGIGYGLLEDNWTGIVACATDLPSLFRDLWGLWDVIVDFHWALIWTYCLQLWGAIDSTFSEITNCSTIKMLIQGIYQYFYEFDVWEYLINIGKNILIHGIEITYDIFDMFGALASFEWRAAGLDIGTIIRYILM